MTLTEQLRAAVLAADTTPGAIAIQAGISPSMMSHFLRGMRGLTLGSAGKLCDVLGLRLEQTGEVHVLPAPQRGRPRKGSSR